MNGRQHSDLWELALTGKVEKTWNHDASVSLLAKTDIFDYFSSNSCNFIQDSDRDKRNCPTGHVFCKKTGSKPNLVKTKMTFREAQLYCAKLSGHICK